MTWCTHANGKAVIPCRFPDLGAASGLGFCDICGQVVDLEWPFYWPIDSTVLFAFEGISVPLENFLTLAFGIPTRVATMPYCWLHRSQDGLVIRNHRHGWEEVSDAAWGKCGALLKETG